MNLNLEFAEPVQWSQENEYSINDVVFNGTEAYTAIDYVPSGTALTNTAYWKKTGKYIRTSNLADGAVTTPKLADGAVTTPKLADGAITVDVLPDLITSQGQGESVTAADASYLASLTVDGKAVQDGTPTPSAPVDVQVVAPINLYPKGVDSSATNANTNVTTAIENGIFKLTGTAVSTGGRLDTIYKSRHVKLAAGTYIISIKSEGTGTVLCYLMNYTTNTGIELVDDGTVFTLADETDIFIGINVGATGTINRTIAIQIEKGTTASEYVVGGSIGLKVGSTITPIDLGGEVLAGISDVKDILNIDSIGHKLKDKRIGVVDLGTLNWSSSSTPANHVFRAIISTCKPQNNLIPANALCSNYRVKAYTPLSASDDGYFAISDGRMLAIIEQSCSTNDAFTALVSGVMLYYELATPETVDLGYIDMPAIPDGAAISITAQVTPTITASWWVNMASGVAEAIRSMRDDLVGWFDGKITTLASSLAKVESGAASTNYTVGSYLVVENVLYKVTSAIASGESIVPGTNVTATTVMAEIVELTS